MIYIHVDLEVTLRSRDLRSTVDLDLMRSSYTYFDVYDYGISMVMLVHLYRAISSIVVGKKLPCHQVPLFGPY